MTDVDRAIQGLASGNFRTNTNNPSQVARNGLPLPGTSPGGFWGGFGSTLGHFANGFLFREFPEYAQSLTTQGGLPPPVQVSDPSQRYQLNRAGVFGNISPMALVIGAAATGLIAYAIFK